MTLNPKQKRHLKGLVHHLKPVVIVGQHGLTPSVLSEIGQALEAHELIKVRVNAGDSTERKAMSENICTECDCQLIHAIGHVVAFYRRHPKKPKIALPST